MMTMGAGLFTALQYETMQKTQGGELAAFLQKLGIAMPDFAAEDAYDASRSLNDQIVSKLCGRLHAKTLRKGCEQLLSVANIPAPRSDTHEKLFARVVEHRGDILDACKKKRPQPKNPSRTEQTSRTTKRPQLAAGDGAGQGTSIAQKPVLAGVGAAVIVGGIAAVAGASAGVVATVGCVAGVASGAAANHLKQTAAAASRSARRFAKKSSICTDQMPPAASESSPDLPFSWDNTRLDELAETLDLLTALSSLAAASHRA